MGDMSLNAARQMVTTALNDPYSPGKVDKFEAIEMKEKLTKDGAQPNSAAKAFLADQVQAGRFDQGAAAVMQELFSRNDEQSFEQKVVQQADVAIKAVHESLDFGFIGHVNSDNTVTGSENADDAAKMAEKFLGELKKLSNESTNLNKIVSATLEGGKMIQDPEKRLNSYLKTLSQIKADFTNNDKDIKRLAHDAIQNIHTAVQSRGGSINPDGTIANYSNSSIYSGAYDQLSHIRNSSGNEFIRNQAINGLNAAYSATGTSYQAATNIILQTLKNIAGESVAPKQHQQQPAPKAEPKGDITVETTVKTTIKQ